MNVLIEAQFSHLEARNSADDDALTACKQKRKGTKKTKGYKEIEKIKSAFIDEKRELEVQNLRLVNKIYADCLVDILKKENRNKIPFRKSDVKFESLDKDSRQRLEPGKWLDDECINKYIELLSDSEAGRQGKSYCFNTFFYSTLMRDDHYNFGRVRRWTRNIPGVRKGVDVSNPNLKVIGIPINLMNTHWISVVILFQDAESHGYGDSSREKGEYPIISPQLTTKIQELDDTSTQEHKKTRFCKVVIYDSLRPFDDNEKTIDKTSYEITENIKRWLKDEMETKDPDIHIIWNERSRDDREHLSTRKPDKLTLYRALGQLSMYLEREKGRKSIADLFSFEELIKDDISNPQQNNCYDCGIFTAMTLRWCFGLAPLFLSPATAGKAREQLRIELSVGKCIDLTSWINAKQRQIETESIK